FVLIAVLVSTALGIYFMQQKYSQPGTDPLPDDLDRFSSTDLHLDSKLHHDELTVTQPNKSAAVSEKLTTAAPEIKELEQILLRKLSVTFSKSPEVRLRELLRTRDSKSIQTYMPVMRASAQSIKPHKYIFATSLSSNHFNELQGLVYNFKQYAFKQVSNYTLVIYDLGLTAAQKKLTLIEKCEILVYHDTSVRWNNSTKGPEVVFKLARERGMQLRYDPSGSIATRTVVSTFTYFGDQACQFEPHGEVQGGLGVYHNEKFVRDVVLDTWVSCAFNTSCMCVPNAGRLLYCNHKLPRKTSVCHRFDQSALGIIISTLYRERTALVVGLDKSITVQRGQTMNWFKP
ncbi:hypothetical protein BaRGS_00016820, partial [Batillaria attramentaria]